MPTTPELIEQIVSEISSTMKQVDAEQISLLQSAILDANRIFIVGKGRTGLQMKAFAMRLMHLGLAVHVIDDVTTPAIQSGDLLLIGSGSGRTPSLINYAETCQKLGVPLALITGNPTAPLADLAKTAVLIPATNFKSGSYAGTTSVMKMGSLFEHVLGLLCDLMIIHLADALDQQDAMMNTRHANLE